MVSGQAGDREFLSEPRSPLPTGDGRDTGLLRQCFQVKFSPKGEIKEGGNMHLISCSVVGSTWTSGETGQARTTLYSPVKAKTDHRAEKVSVRKWTGG